VESTVVAQRRITALERLEAFLGEWKMEASFAPTA
jgi:hypothetical protein